MFTSQISCGTLKISSHQFFKKIPNKIAGIMRNTDELHEMACDGVVVGTSVGTGVGFSVGWLVGDILVVVVDVVELSTLARTTGASVARSSPEPSL